jgi:thioredoxin reductase
MKTYDVVVIGGGAAGLNAALTLGRSRRSVLVVDEGSPRNAPAEHMHNYLTRDGMSPMEFLELGRKEVLGYGVDLRTARVTSVTSVAPGFTVAMDDDSAVTARRLLVTTGVTDVLPDVPGLRERWGREVIHCPYCHGYEVRDQPIGVLHTGNAMHQALLFRQLSADVTVFTHTGPALPSEDLATLADRGIRVVDGEVSGLETVDERLTGVRVGGKVSLVRALAVAPKVRANLVPGLDLPIEENPMGTFVPADMTGRTSVPGVWVAGNVRTPFAQVIAAAAEGSMAAAMINADLLGL